MQHFMHLELKSSMVDHFFTCYSLVMNYWNLKHPIIKAVLLFCGDYIIRFISASYCGHLGLCKLKFCLLCWYVAIPCKLNAFLSQQLNE